MPSAVWQGFCSLLRDPPPVTLTEWRLHRPYYRGSLGGHGASLGLSKTSMTAQEAHPGRPRGLEDSPRALQYAQDGPKTAQEGPKTPRQDSKRTPDGATRPRG